MPASAICILMPFVETVRWRTSICCSFVDCARAVLDHAMAPPASAMNSRRRILHSAGWIANAPYSARRPSAWQRFSHSAAGLASSIRRRTRSTVASVRPATRTFTSSPMCSTSAPADRRARGRGGGMAYGHELSGVPPDASMLYALEIPAEGGDTWICGMAAGRACPRPRRTAAGSPYQARWHLQQRRFPAPRGCAHRRSAQGARCLASGGVPASGDGGPQPTSAGGAIPTLRASADGVGNAARCLVGPY